MSKDPVVAGLRNRRRRSGPGAKLLRRRPLFLEALEDRRLLACDAIPATTVALPAEPFIGEEVRFSVIFENTGTVPGYGPFVDLVLPRNGTDGAAGTGTPDGLTFISATYLGTPVTSTVFLFPDDDGAGPGTTGTILHPYAVDSSGNPLTVTGTTGDQLVVFQLPFGSFVPAQPEAAIQVSAAMSNLADLNEPLTVQARGGFQFGCDELDNPTAPDPTILTPGSTASDSSTWVDFAATSPVLMRMTKTYNGPENETATGPNYLRTWTLTTSIAAGQTVTDLDIIDGLPNNVVVTNIVFPLADPGTVPATPFGPVNVTYPSELLLGAVPSITGTGGADVVVVIEFYVPEFDANGERVIPINGEDDIGPSPGPPPTINSTSPNLARSVGDWDPIDDRDPAGSGNAVAETPVEDLDDKSIAIQKSAEIVVDVAPTGTPGNPLISPGDVIEYTLDFQISDYYTFGDLVVTDTIRDGQNFDATFAPIFEVRDRLGTVVGAFVLGSNYTYTNNDASDGTEILVFDVSQALIDANPDPDNGDWLYDGILEGGNTRGEPDSAPSAAATGVIRFRTVIQQYYAQNPPSGNPSVVQGDMISNDVIIAGSVRENFEDDTNGIYFEVIYPEERDDSSAGVGMETGSVAKSIYAVNGSQAFSPMNLAPGDLVTYRVQYLMPLSRFEDFRLTDYVPLPVFHVADPNADGVVGPAWSFDLAGSFDAAPPPVGVVQFGPDDTFYNLHAPASNIIPTLTVDAAANSIRFYYGDYADPVIATSTIDLLFTLTVRDAPFADGLFLTNIVRAEKQNSFNDPAIEDELVQIQLGQPVLGITKGVVSTDRVGAVFSPATVGPVGVSFAAPGTLPAFSGTVTSSGLENWPINSNLSGIDAGDLVRFAIAVENTGSSRAGAFDVRIQDTLPAGFAVPSGGLNLSVTDGTGAVIVYNDLGGGLFGTGIELVDPGPTDTTANPPGDNTNAGALDQYSETSGRNILIVTYDLVAVGPPAADSVQPRQTITNTATLFNYASTEGGPDHTVTDLTDDARVTTRDPAVTKTLLGTSVVTPNNSNTQAVIGELITYRVVVTVPEGTINNARVVDTLDLGLRFVSLDSVVASSGDVTSTLAIATPSTAPNDGDSGSQTVTFDLGTITNTNVNNAIAETITLTYTVRVLNTNANQSGIQRNNSARFRWTVDGTANNTPASSAANVRIIEPVLQVDKSVVVAGSGTTGQFGDPVEYTIVIGHAGASDATDAYDVTFSDALPVTYVNVTGFTATHSAGPVDLSGIFEISGGTLQTQAGQSFDLLIGQTVTITVSGTLTLAVQPGQTIDNVATVRWTSLDGAETGSGNVDGERNGSGGVNDYFASDNAIVSILPFAPGKSVISTNQLHTDDLDVAIGEIVTYRIALQVPQGTSSNVTLIDSLDPGLAIVDLPTLADHLTITASSSHVTTSIGDFDTVVANALVSPNGGSLTLDFGNVINDNEDPAEIETIEITYSVVVLNTSTNLRGVGRNNSATINWIAGGVPQSATISAPDVTIVEPELQIIKSNGSPATGEAGDIITFLIVVQHTPDSNADAFDVQLVDVINSLPNKMTYVPSSFANPAGAPPSLYSESGGDLTVTWAQFPLGATSTITFQVTLDITVNPEEILTNTGNLTWTSLPGDITTPQSSNPNSVERTGNPGDPGELNNYAGSDSGIVTILSVDPTKAIVETSEPHTPGSDVAVGEIVRYRLQTSLIEGTTPNLQLVDTLPAGLILLDLDQVLVSFTSDQPMGLAVDLSPPNPDPNNSQVPPTVVLPSSRIGIAGQTITFSLGDVVNNDNDVDIEFVTLEFNVLVTNTAVVNNGQVKTNLFQVFVDGAQFGPTRSVDVTVREPLIANVSKTVLSGAPVDAGDPVTYEVSFSNTGATTAFDVRLLDELDPLWFDSVSVDSITLGGGSLGPIVDDSAGTTVDITVASVPVGGTVVVRYTAILSVNVQPGQTIPNVADVTYTSLPDGGTPLGPDNLTGSITPGGSGAPNGERDGSGGVNDYANSDQADVTLTGQPLFQKLLAGSNQFYTVDPQLTIGEQATYTLVLTIPEGTLPNVLIADIMPAGLVLVAFDSITPSSPAVTTDVAGGFAQILADANAGLFFDDTSFGLDFGTLTNTDTDDLVTETLVITYRAVVLDVMANVSGQTRTNDASFTWDGGTIDDDVTIEIVEPDLTIAKDTNVMVVDGGDTITFTITVDHTASSTAWALDVTVYDTLPAGLTYVGGECGYGFRPCPHGERSRAGSGVFLGPVPVGRRTVFLHLRCDGGREHYTVDDVPEHCRRGMVDAAGRRS
jgi:fimbrial isopeptide formation D2 family protein/uncharacterized repeat protein (TIGR01451 family)